ncbi:NAD(P)-dependent oxidoreductase [Sporomusa sphaeroides DSM 2875]|uniref:NAD-dependent epimerase/dehydratase family protein n=1 Tax=Sporomusa sphaeroides TaxID=47679 RepID=UPI00202FAFE4|nr:NAD(P)-dependent oxidoreductase [Sporomusa sphaeroides]MCM0761003.1 NAD(P)-dependent oxidoreductase [Sporomusa sphaeroides DSM 2875]
MRKKVLMVGASGFIGQNLKEYLGKETDLYAIYAPTSKEFDISDEQEVKNHIIKQYYDVIIHAAVYNPRVGYNKDATKELDKNLRMFFNFERYQGFYGKMLYFGSGAEFDKRDVISMIDENSVGNGIPETDYGFYKYIINQAIKSSENIYNLRVFGLFGKYENWRRTFISGACCKALKNIPITMRQNVYFDYMYVNDFCRIIKWFIDNDVKHKTYNITTGKRIDLISIAEIVKKISKKNIPIYICKEGLAHEYSASNQRLLDEIHSFTFTPMEDAIQDLYSWYCKQEEDIDIYSLLYQ